jgi:biofilm protein TabA
MIADKIKNWKSVPGFVSDPVWAEAFAWIEENAATAEDGIYPLSGEVYVRVMQYDLKERGVARYESHRHTIDLQFTIEGAEGIEVCPVEELNADGEYRTDKDFQYYLCPGKGLHRVENVKGHFCVLFPQDGHMPQLYVNGHTHVKKLVVKIPVNSIK